jgi:hypothetical protein
MSNESTRAGGNAPRAKSITETAVAIGVTFVLIIGLMRLLTGSWWPALFAMGPFLLGVLGAIFPTVGRATEFAARKYFRFVWWMLVFFGPASVLLWSARFIVARRTVWFQVGLLVLWGALLVWAVTLIFTKERREKLFTKLQRIGALTPWAYSLNVLALGVFYFGTVTLLLSRWNMISLEGNPERVFDFYVWHFLDAVPLLHINDTLHWAQPMTYQASGVGFLLLSFKVTIILPVIATFTGYWKFRRDQRKAAQT